MSTYFRTSQAAALAGISMRMMQYWDEMGFVRSERVAPQEHLRMYSEQKVLELMVLAEMQARGMARKERRPTIAGQRARLAGAIGLLKNASRSMPRNLMAGEYLMFDGRVLEMYTSAAEAIDRAERARAGVWFIAMKRKQDDVRRAAAGLEMVQALRPGAQKILKVIERGVHASTRINASRSAGVSG